MTTTPTYGPVDYLQTEPRYTTIDAIKFAMGITDTRYDDEVQTALVSLETMIDVFLGRSFPDTGDNPAIDGIPKQVEMAATVGGMECFKMFDSPAGTGGSDSDGFIGLYDPAAAARNAFNLVRPMLSGLKIQWGVS